MTVAESTVSALRDPPRDKLAGEPLYLDVGGTAVYAVLHMDQQQPSRDTAVLICPPFGLQEVCCYRILRAWAMQLARAGYPTLRITFQSSGDSGGTPRDPGRLDAWTNAVTVAAAELRCCPDVDSVIALGLGLGGVLAVRAAAGIDSELDGLALWAVPARAKDLVRQLKAFSRLEYPLFFQDLEAPPPLAEGELEAGGFVISAETASDLNALDLAELRFERPLSRGVLLLERDGIRTDAALREALERQRIATTVAPAQGWAAMTSHPQQSVVPDQAVNCLFEWLDAGSAEAASRSHLDTVAAVPASAHAAEIRLEDGSSAIERPISIDVDGLTLNGILTTPRTTRAPVGAVFLHAGAIRRIGPNRMWVELARRWAARGVPSLRLDVEGIGDSGGAVAPYREDAPLHDDKFLGQVVAAVDQLVEHHVADRFVLVGLCSGAYWALHTGLEHQRVTGVFLVNPRVLVFDSALAPTRDLRRAFSERLTLAKLRRTITRQRVAAVLRWVLNAPLRRLARIFTDEQRSVAAQLDDVLTQMHRSDKLVALVFSEREPLDEELTASGRLAEMESWPNIMLQRIAVRDHTLRPTWAQQQALAALDRALARELSGESVALRHEPAVNGRPSL